MSTPTDYGPIGNAVILLAYLVCYGFFAFVVFDIWRTTRRR